MGCGLDQARLQQRLARTKTRVRSGLGGGYYGHPKQVVAPAGMCVDGICGGLAGLQHPLVHVKYGAEMEHAGSKLLPSLALEFPEMTPLETVGTTDMFITEDTNEPWIPVEDTARRHSPCFSAGP